MLRRVFSCMHSIKFRKNDYICTDLVLGRSVSEAQHKPKRTK